MIVPSRSPGGTGLDSTLRSFGVLEPQSGVRSAQGRSEQSSVVGRDKLDPDKGAWRSGHGRSGQCSPWLKSKTLQLTTEILQASKLFLRLAF